MLASLFSGKCFKGVAVSACLLASSVCLAGSAGSGRDLIKKMSEAMQGLNYAGTFVYVHDGDVETMRIHHSRADGIERERLFSLNGEPREIIRNADSVVCIWPGSKSVSVSKAEPRTPFPEFNSDQLARLSKLYEFTRAGRDRVAGRIVEVVDIKPLDDYRYGYRLWIDAETYLMLRSVMSNNHQRIIEQVMFTEVEYVDRIALEAFQSSLEGKKYEWLVDLDKPLAEPDPDSDIPAITLDKPPLGFALMSDKLVMLPEQSVVRRVMYTDGLASLSIYVAQTSGDTKDVLHGLTGMGAVHAYGVMKDKWHVTVVGEVPQATVKMIANSLSLVAR